jgi:two-component system, NtrC family, sensor histidine kinase HydH
MITGVLKVFVKAQDEGTIELLDRFRRRRALEDRGRSVTEKELDLGRTLMTPAEIPERTARAHAMKNCLSVVRAIAHLVKPELSGRGAERLERLDAAIARMTELVEEDLALTPREPGPPDRLLVRALVRSVTEMLYDRAEAAHVALLVNCDDGWVRGHEAPLREALFNLIANAVEATPAGGAVLVDTCTTDDGDQLWSVQDTGAGMPADVLRQLGAVRRSFRKNGAGVGVALAAEVFLEHEGLVRFESTRNSGTRVTIWLPGAADSEGDAQARGRTAPW